MIDLVIRILATFLVVYELVLLGLMAFFLVRFSRKDK